MKILMSVAVAGLMSLAVANVSAADSGMALAQKNACMSCHGVDKKIVGPAFKDVAAKYKGDKTALDRLVNKVHKGGSGVWGQIPMPPNPQVNDADAKTIVAWVLSL